MKNKIYVVANYGNFDGNPYNNTIAFTNYEDARNEYNNQIRDTKDCFETTRRDGAKVGTYEDDCEWSIYETNGCYDSSHCIVAFMEVELN